MACLRSCLHDKRRAHFAALAVREGVVDEQRQALEAGRAVPIQDGPQTYYVISADQLEKMKALLEVAQTDPSFYEAGEVHLYLDQ